MTHAGETNQERRAKELIAAAVRLVAAQPAWQVPAETLAAIESALAGALPEIVRAGELVRGYAGEVAAHGGGG